MPPVQDNEGLSQMGVYFPNNVKEALFLLAHERSEPRDEVSASGLVRDYVTNCLHEEVQNGEVPEEIADLLNTSDLGAAGEGAKMTEVTE